MNYKGQLEGFPQEVVEAMLNEQVKQGYPRDITVFERNKTSGNSNKGFVWYKTNDGVYFWNKVIESKNFDMFFTKYPKKSEYPKVMMVRDREYEYWMKKTVLAYLGDDFIEPYVVDDGFEDGKISHVCYRFAKEVEQPVEVTMEDVAKALGIDIKLLRIKD